MAMEVGRASEIVQEQQQQGAVEGEDEGDIKKLTDSGAYTIDALAYAAKKDLCNIKGLREAKVNKLQKEAYKHAYMGFTTASNVAAQIKELWHLTTGCKELDRIFEGGFETGYITEMYGEFRSGKTQLCHTLCVTCQVCGKQLPIERAVFG